MLNDQQWSQLLLSFVEEAHDLAKQAEEAAARLGVSLVLPTGITLLPAFVVLGIVLGAAALELVDRHDLGEVEHVDLLELARRTEVAGHHVHREIDDPGELELVLVDQAQLRQRHWEPDATGEHRLPGFLFKRLDGLGQIATDQLRVPIDLAERAGNDVLLHRINGPCERVRPLGHCQGPRLQPPRFLHHLVGDATKEQRIGAAHARYGMVMCCTQRLLQKHRVRRAGAMVDTTVDRHVDGVEKGSHYGRCSFVALAEIARSNFCSWLVNPRIAPLVISGSG